MMMVMVRNCSIGCCCFVERLHNCKCTVKRLELSYHSTCVFVSLACDDIKQKGKSNQKKSDNTTRRTNRIFLTWTRCQLTIQTDGQMIQQWKFQQIMICLVPFAQDEKIVLNTLLLLFTVVVVFI